MRPCAQLSQSAICRSVPHTPAWRTAISTSPGPARGLGTVRTLRPGARDSFTTACIVSGMCATGRGAGRSQSIECDRAGNIVRRPQPEMQSGAGIMPAPLASLAVCLVSCPRRMGIDGQPLVDVISGLGVVGAPAVRPDAGRARQTLSRAEDDADWFVVEHERKTGHDLHLSKWRAISMLLLSHFISMCYNKWQYSLFNTLTRVGLCPCDAFASQRGPSQNRVCGGPQPCAWHFCSVETRLRNVWSPWIRS